MTTIHFLILFLLLTLIFIAYKRHKTPTDTTLPLKDQRTISKYDLAKKDVVFVRGLKRDYFAELEHVKNLEGCIYKKTKPTSESDYGIRFTVPPIEEDICDNIAFLVLEFDPEADYFDELPEYFRKQTYKDFIGDAVYIKKIVKPGTPEYKDLQREIESKNQDFSL